MTKVILYGLENYRHGTTALYPNLRLIIKLIFIDLEDFKIISNCFSVVFLIELATHVLIPRPTTKNISINNWQKFEKRKFRCALDVQYLFSESVWNWNEHFNPKQGLLVYCVHRVSLEKTTCLRSVLHQLNA